MRQAHAVALPGLHWDAKAQGFRGGRRPSPRREHEGLASEFTGGRESRLQAGAFPAPTGDLRVPDDAATEALDFGREQFDQLTGIKVRVLREHDRAGDGVIDARIATADLVGGQDFGRDADGVGLRGEDGFMVEGLLRATQRQQADGLERERPGELLTMTQEDLAAAQVEVAQDRRAAVDVTLVGRTPELPAPASEVEVEPRAHPERAFTIKHPLQAEHHHARRGQRHEVARHDHPSVAKRTRIMIGRALLEQHDRATATQELIGGAQAHDTTPDDDDRCGHGA